MFSSSLCKSEMKKESHSYSNNSAWDPGRREVHDCKPIKSTTLLSWVFFFFEGVFHKVQSFPTFQLLQHLQFHSRTVGYIFFSIFIIALYSKNIEKFNLLTALCCWLVSDPCQHIKSIFNIWAVLSIFWKATDF
jgi:hypothetical protein